MSNPFSGIITSDMKLLFTNMIDSVLENTALTLPCRFVYGDTKATECPNCYYDAATKKSSNRYKVAGPITFVDGQICPYCHGVGKIYNSATVDDIYLAVIWDSRSWIPMTGLDKVEIENNMVQTLSRLDTTYANILRAKHIIVDTNVENYMTNRYEKVGSPEPCGFGESTYCLSMWRQV